MFLFCSREVNQCIHSYPSRREPGYAVTEMSVPDPFWIEVARTAHELGEVHGVSAVSYAERQAEKALASGKSDEKTFWEAVAASLRPR